MLVQEQSLHSLDLTDLDLDKEETKKEDEKMKKIEEKREEEDEEEERMTDVQRTVIVSEFDEYLDLLEIF